MEGAMQEYQGRGAGTSVCVFVRVCVRVEGGGRGQGYQGWGSGYVRFCLIWCCENKRTTLTTKTKAPSKNVGMRHNDKAAGRSRARWARRTQGCWEVLPSGYVASVVKCVESLRDKTKHIASSRQSGRKASRALGAAKPRAPRGLSFGMCCYALILLELFEFEEHKHDKNLWTSEQHNTTQHKQKAPAGATAPERPEGRKASSCFPSFPQDLLKRS